MYIYTWFFFKYFREKASFVGKIKEIWKIILLPILTILQHLLLHEQESAKLHDLALVEYLQKYMVDGFCRQASVCSARKYSDWVNYVL